MPAQLKIKELESPAWLRQKYWEEKLSLEEIGKLLGCDNSTVQRSMKKLGVPRRSRRELNLAKYGYAQHKSSEWLEEQYVENGLTTQQIADLIGCSATSVVRWMEEFSIPRRVKEPSWNYKFFDELTPDSAYVVGFIIADGHLWKTGYTIAILQKKRAILDKISAVVGGGTVNAKYGYLHLNSKYAHMVLTNRYGIPAGSGKTHTVRIPECIIERADLLPHCIRGIFDGDGSVAKTSCTFFSGSANLLKDIAGILSGVGLPLVESVWQVSNLVKKNGARSGCYILYYNRALETKALAEYIYGPNLDIYGSTLFLGRKKERFDQLFIPWRDKDWLFQKFVVEGKSPGRIAADLPNIDSGAIGKWVNMYGLREARSKHWNLSLGI